MHSINSDLTWRRLILGMSDGELRFSLQAITNTTPTPDSLRSWGYSEIDSASVSFVDKLAHSTSDYFSRQLCVMCEVKVTNTDVFLCACMYGSLHTSHITVC